jgi:hypothetical protein
MLLWNYIIMIMIKKKRPNQLNYFLIIIIDLSKTDITSYKFSFTAYKDEQKKLIN